MGVLLLAAGALAIGGAVRDPEGTQPTAESAGSSGGNQRILRFPQGRRLGFISVREPQPMGGDWRVGWQAVGPARGTLRVPADKDALLHVGAEELANLGRLRMPAPGDIQVVTFYRTPPDAAMDYLAGCGKLKWVAFYEGLPSGRGLAQFSRLKSLEVLMIGHSEITDEGLRTLVDSLKGLKSLRWLGLGTTQLTDAGLTHLRDLKGLKHLWLGTMKHTGVGLQSLQGMKLLESIRPPGGISDEDRAVLGGLTSLTDLEIHSGAVTDAGLAHLKSLKALDRLCLDTPGIKGSGLAHLHGLPIKKLFWTVGRLDQSRLTHLAGLQELELLSISGDSSGGPPLRAECTLVYRRDCSCPLGCIGVDYRAFISQLLRSGGDHGRAACGKESESCKLRLQSLQRWSTARCWATAAC